MTKQPVWSMWVALRTVKVWQAVALSLGLDPDSMRISPHGWMAGPNAPLVFEPSSFGDKEQADAFDWRRRIAASHFGSDEANDRAEGPLSEFVAFAVNLGWPLPVELDREALWQVRAAAEDLRRYTQRERLNLFELACLLHCADPEKVATRAHADLQDRQPQLDSRRAQIVSPEHVLQLVEADPEMLLGSTIGGTLKRLRIAIGGTTLHHSVTLATARRLASGLRLELPEAFAASAAPVPKRNPGNVLRLPAGTTHLEFGDLAHLIADALWPDLGEGDERWHYAGARVNLDEELVAAVESGALQVLDPLTLGPSRFRRGAVLGRSRVAVEDLRGWLTSTRRMEVLVEPAETASVAAPRGLAQVDEPEEQTGAVKPRPAGVRAANAVTTDQVCEAFNGIGGWSKDEWNDTLTKNRPGWVMACRVQKGKQGQGGGQATWDVLQMARALVEGHGNRTPTPPAELDAAFRRPQLSALKDRWRELRNDNPAWGE